MVIPKYLNLMAFHTSIKIVDLNSHEHILPKFTQRNHVLFNLQF